jgi:hypothetical protein
MTLPDAQLNRPLSAGWWPGIDLDQNNKPCDRVLPPMDVGACLLFVIGCTHVKALCRLLCDSFDARAIRGWLSWFSSNDKFNLFGGPVVRCGAAARPTRRSRRSFCETPDSGIL